MKGKQIIGVIAPLGIILTMVPVFQYLAKEFGETLGWYLGFFPYWLIWCGLFPLWLIGKQRLREIIRPQRLEPKIVLLLAVPIVGAAAYKVVPGLNFAQTDPWYIVMMVSSVFGNGFFEEVLWRGVYMELFPKNLFIRIFWASIWFALWHYAPGSVSSDGNVIALIMGSGFFGFYLSFLVKKTNTIWWSIVGHTFGGMIMAF